ncbi:rod-binding protein [Novosphingobium sp. 1949]|uniref:Rod-binding protein n=1 Tax=Novosphingobium organovorum TaxID=2930092 RepID=A0ABT0BHA3_9SPHN|nr:rod-binding protein [Novosphingobium organovorum]MCJ2184358.1 rod-binding protein [Novosphingobium organovorum]
MTASLSSASAASSTAAASSSLVLSPELGLASAPEASQREQLAAAARQFEAIFVRQMLAAARKTSFDENGVFSSQAVQTFREMQDERFAEIASQTGALGLATTIEAQLARYLPPESAAPTQAAPSPDTSTKDS